MAELSFFLWNEWKSDLIMESIGYHNSESLEAWYNNFIADWVKYTCNRVLLMKNFKKISSSTLE